MGGDSARWGVEKLGAMRWRRWGRKRDVWGMLWTFYFHFGEEPISVRLVMLRNGNTAFG